MKKLLFFFLLIVAFKSNAQTFTQTYVDKCSGEIKIVVSTPMPNGMVMIAFYNQIKVFNNTQVTDGTVQTWLTQVYADYNSRPCPVSVVAQQTVQQTVANAAAAAASNAASAAASNAASSAASSSASSSASSTASASASAGSSSSSSSSSGSNESSSSGENKSSSSESKSESKSEEKKSESKSEEKSEEKKEESKEEKSEEKKEEKKKEEEKKKKEEQKKKRESMSNPTLVASDVAVTEAKDGKYSAMISTGISKSSMTGAESWSLTSMIWTTFNQFALSGGYTKMNVDNNGVLKNINSYSMTAAYLQGNIMIMQGYTFIKPDPKFGTYGYNLGVVSLLLKGDHGYNYSASVSSIVFWTKVIPMNKKVAVSPQLFLTNSPITWNPSTGQTIVSRQYGFLAGFSYDYKLTKRFGLGLNYKFSGSTQADTKILHNFMIGSRLMF